MDFLLVLFLLVFLAFIAVLPVSIAHHKGIALTGGQMFGWLLFGIFIPVVAIIVALVMQPRYEEAEADRALHLRGWGRYE